jgi:hypothetical protein
MMNVEEMFQELRWVREQQEEELLEAQRAFEEELRRKEEEAAAKRRALLLKVEKRTEVAAKLKRPPKTKGVPLTQLLEMLEGGGRMSHALGADPDFAHPYYETLANDRAESAAHRLDTMASAAFPSPRPRRGRSGHARQRAAASLLTNGGDTVGTGVSSGSRLQQRFTPRPLAEVRLAQPSP